MDHSLLIISAIQQQLIAYIPKFILALCLFLGFYLIALVFNWLIMRIHNKSPVSKQPVFFLLAQTSKIATIIVGLITALSTLGINVNALVASLGLSGFALGFALKDLLANLLAGMMVLVYRPFNIGDEISIQTHTGKVIAINLRYTEISTDHKKVLIPNSLVFTTTLIVNT